MIQDYPIRKENIKAHIDIERELLKVNNKWYHFEVRCSSGNIVDLVFREHIDYEKSE